MDKHEAQRKHAKQRAMERFGLNVNRAELDRLVRLIQAGNAKLLGRQSLRVSYFRVTIVDGDSSAEAVAVYDGKRKSIATFLTNEMFASKHAVDVHTPKEGTKT